MKELQKVVIGISESTHRQLTTSARIIRSLRFLLACLAIGSRTVALADNSQLRRDLSARARLLYEPAAKP